MSAGDESDVRAVAGGEHHHRVLLLELRERLLELHVDFHRAAEDRRAGGAEAVVVERLLGGRDHLGVIRETEVVVRREVQQLEPLVSQLLLEVDARAAAASTSAARRGSSRCSARARTTTRCTGRRSRRCRRWTSSRSCCSRSPRCRRPVPGRSVVDVPGGVVFEIRVAMGGSAPWCGRIFGSRRSM